MTVGSSGIERKTKKKNAARKAEQHRANLKLRAEMNKQADKSEGNSPRPWPGMRG